MPSVVAIMIVILILGIGVDAVFGVTNARHPPPLGPHVAREGHHLIERRAAFPRSLPFHLHNCRCLLNAASWIAPPSPKCDQPDTAFLRLNRRAKGGAVAMRSNGDGHDWGARAADGRGGGAQASSQRGVSRRMLIAGGGLVLGAVAVGWRAGGIATDALDPADRRRPAAASRSRALARAAARHTDRTGHASHASHASHATAGRHAGEADRPSGVITARGARGARGPTTPRPTHPEPPNSRCTTSTTGRRSSP